MAGAVGVNDMTFADWEKRPTLPRRIAAKVILLLQHLGLDLTPGDGRFL